MTTLIEKTIRINNITDNDISSNQIRITVDNKHLFPKEKLGEPVVYDLNIIFNEKEYSCTYRIGSRDGKSRSGVIKLGRTLVTAMNLTSTDVIEISVLSNGDYFISKLK